ncbi:MAG TPA: nucleotidyltransferase family protein [Epsilonproteobacteria bacterium]|nr:nucleotidyltransferase family protein [Campylobacterota bacterium]
MVAMILAAGRGERMRPLSDTIPKPLLQVGGKPLLVWHIQNLALAGFNKIVINIAYLANEIVKTIGDGSKWGVEILYSDERIEGALESAGGIIKALPLLGEGSFLVVNGDIWCDYNFDPSFILPDNALAHLVLVPNPPHNKKGDFSFDEGSVCLAQEKTYTFSGIGYYSVQLFQDLEYGRRGLGELIRSTLAKKRFISGEIYHGRWFDIGTPQRLAYVDNLLKRL